MSYDPRDIMQVEAPPSVSMGSGRAFRELLDRLPVAVVEHSADTSVLFRNRYALELLGLTEDEATIGIVSDSRWTFHREDGTAMPFEELPVVRVVDTLDPLENYVMGVSGPSSEEVTWIRVDAYPQCDEEKVLQTVLVMFADVTCSRKDAEDLHNERGRLSRLLDALGDPVFVKDNEHRVVLANQAFGDIFGVDLSTVMGMTLAEHVPVDERVQFLAVDRAVLDTGVTDVRLETLTLEGNDPRTILTRKARITDPSGNVFLVGSIHDVTAEKSAEEALIRNERALRKIGRTAKVGGWELDANTLELTWTEETFRIHEMPVGSSPSLEQSVNFYHPDDIGRIGDAVQNALEGEPWDDEFRLITAKGNFVWTRSIGTPVVVDGKTVKLEGTFQDIEDLKQAEAERLSLERQVQQAHKMESLGVMAGGVAHDFNNLLSVILGNAGLALDTLSPDSPARGNIEEVEKASQRAADLAKQMLAYSGQDSFVADHIDLGKVIDEMGHLLDVAISKKVLLRYDFADNLPTLDGDATKLRQVIMNLIINASEAIGDQDGMITLSTGSLHGEGRQLEEIDADVVAGSAEAISEDGYVYLEVADTGCGMNAETLEKIFDPFYTTKFTGRGLGMSSALGIVRGHGGAISISSDVGKGTSFKIFFPANALSENAPSENDVAVTGGKDEAEQTAGQPVGTILVVDDEVGVRAVGQQMVERLGYTALMAADGREAVELFREHSTEIICVLLDLTMPHLDGREAFHEMLGIRPDVNVILCSGYNVHDESRRFTEEVPAGFLQKPYQIAELREKLAEVLAPEPA